MIKVHLIGFWRNLISGESGGEGGAGLAPFRIYCILNNAGSLLLVMELVAEMYFQVLNELILWKQCFIKWEVFPKNVVLWEVCMLITVLLLKCPSIIVNGKWWDILIHAGDLDILALLRFVSSSEGLEGFSARILSFFRPCFVPFWLLEVACTTV